MVKKIIPLVALLAGLSAPAMAEDKYDSAFGAREKKPYQIGLGFHLAHIPESSGTTEFLREDREMFNKSMPIGNDHTAFGKFLQVGKIKPTIEINGSVDFFELFDVNLLPKDGLKLGPYVGFGSSHIFGDVKAKKLVELGHLEETLSGKYEHFPESTKAPRKLERDLGKTFDSVGKLLEFITHKVIQKLPSYGQQIPVGIGDLIPGNDKQEMINLDLSTYVSPLFTRVMRTAFSIHDKHKYKNINIPTQITIPRFTPCNGNELSLDEVFHNRRNFRNSANYAGAITMNIPTANNGVLKLIKDYENSELFKFHQDFDHQPDLNRQEAFHRAINDQRLDDKTRSVLEHPNPRSKNPRALVRFINNLLENDWHPKHIGNLIADMYEQPQHDWNGDNWMKYPSRTRANFWARIYSGIELVD